MLTYVLRRLLYSLIVVLVGSYILFWAVRKTFDPLDKLRLSHDPTVVARQRAALRLDDPLPVQYWTWLRQFVRGDWGVSSNTNQDVLPLIGHALATTLQLMFWGLLVSVVFATLIGVYTAVKAYTVGDFVFSGLSYAGLAMPAFWLGLVLIQFLAVLPQANLGLASPPLYFVGLHSAGMSGFNLDYVRHLVLPVLTLSAALIGAWSRFLRSSMLDTLNSDYVRTARAKGVPRRQVIRKHALRNSLGPLTTVIALDAGLLLGGLVVTEQVFSIDGMGRLFVRSIEAGDPYVLLPWMVIVAIAVIGFNLLADVAYARLDPRVRR